MCSSGCLGVSAGFLSLITLISAVISGSWLYTRESVRLPGSQSVTAVTFRIGLWRVCPALKRIVTSPGTLLPAPGCQLIQYSSWPEVKETDLGISWSSLEFTPSFVTKMRYAMPLVALALALLMLATLFALLGHCHADLKTLVACGLYTIGGLMLASGLIVFVSVLSDVTTGPKKLEYRYGWSFHAAGTAFILSEIAALVSISAYLRRFSSVEDMVRAMVPGADRKLRHRQLCDEYLSRTEQGVENSLPTPPDVCTAKPQLGPISGRKSVKGVPITSMYDGIAKPPLHKRPQDPLMPQSHPATLVLPEHERYRYTTIIHQGLLGVAEGSSSSGSSATSGGSCSHSPPRSRLPALSPSRGRLPVHSPHCPRSSSPSSVSLGYCSAVT